MDFPDLEELPEKEDIIRLKELLLDIKSWDVDEFLLLPVDLRKRIQDELDP